MPKSPVQSGMHVLSLQSPRDSLLKPFEGLGDLFPSTTVFSFTGSGPGMYNEAPPLPKPKSGALHM